MAWGGKKERMIPDISHIRAALASGLLQLMEDLSILHAALRATSNFLSHITVEVGDMCEVEVGTAKVAMIVTFHNSLCSAVEWIRRLIFVGMSSISILRQIVRLIHNLYLPFFLVSHCGCGVTYK
jgi:hypothetical protein